MTPRTVLLAILRESFPDWDLWICDRGIWRAAGATLISASSVERFLSGLAEADPDAFRDAVKRCAGRWPDLY